MSEGPLNLFKLHPLCFQYLSFAAAKSLQSCPTLCGPRDGGPPGSTIPGILQARTLEWVAISFSNEWKWKVKVKSLSRVRLVLTPWTAAYQAPATWPQSPKSYDFSSSHEWMWELDHKKSREPKNWCLWTAVLEKTLESPLDCKDIKPINPKGNQPWIFIGRTDAKAETPILWLLDVKSWLIGKDPDAEKRLRAGEEGDNRG